MAPTLLGAIRGIIPRTTATDSINLLATRNDNKDRVRPTVDPAAGVLDPHNINNVGFFVLFALIGVAFVIGGIWFFFWAKNGGFQFQENDWDDYKSTVLRRTGPNGTILSGATKTTRLGGGSVYKDVDEDDTTTVVTESTALSGITAGASDIDAREKRKRKQEKRERDKARREAAGKGRSSRRHVGDEGVEDPEAETQAKKELRKYRHEKAARVGGLNKESEGSQWDGSTNPTESNVSSDRQSAATATSSRDRAGIRKVYSVADRRAEREAEREAERARTEARRQRERSRPARRDFSFQRGDESAVSESLLESHHSSSDLGTKSYHHPMPELRELEQERERERDRERQERAKAREDRRARRGGYRRGRGEDYDG